MQWNFSCAAPNRKKSFRLRRGHKSQRDVRCQVKTRPLAEVNEVFEELRRGSIAGRIVLLH
jgi:D-arabinose 1-dehydrogenase-like Zn-dependent alcohol dehydrogenase